MSSILQIGFVHDGKGTAYAVGHEGRHRATALKAMGIKSVPVLLSCRKWKGELIKWNRQSNPKEYGYFNQIWPKVLKGEAGQSTEVDFPVKDMRPEGDPINNPDIGK